MTPASDETRRNRLILFALWLALYASFTLLTPPLLDDADSVHAEVSREMLLRHDWVTLYANGIRYLEKAPLLYWSMAASFRLFGVRTVTARLPLALTVLALTLILEAFARRAFTALSHRDQAPAPASTPDSSCSPASASSSSPASSSPTPSSASG